MDSTPETPGTMETGPLGDGDTPIRAFEPGGANQFVSNKIEDIQSITLQVAGELTASEKGRLQEQLNSAFSLDGIGTVTYTENRSQNFSGSYYNADQDVTIYWWIRMRGDRFAGLYIHEAMANEIMKFFLNPPTPELAIFEEAESSDEIQVAPSRQDRSLEGVFEFEDGRFRVARDKDGRLTYFEIDSHTKEDEISTYYRLWSGDVMSFLHTLVNVRKETLEKDRVLSLIPVAVDPFNPLNDLVCRHIRADFGDISPAQWELNISVIMDRKGQVISRYPCLPSGVVYVLSDIGGIWARTYALDARDNQYSKETP